MTFDVLLSDKLSKDLQFTTLYELCKREEVERDRRNLQQLEARKKLSQSLICSYIEPIFSWFDDKTLVLKFPIHRLNYICIIVSDDL